MTCVNGEKQRDTFGVELACPAISEQIGHLSIALVGLMFSDKFREFEETGLN
jgi:hypothetical protein